MIKKAVMVNYRSGISFLFLCAFFCVVFVTGAFAREMIEYPRVKLQSLDKITARTMTFEADAGSTLRFGPLYIRVQKCMKSSPIDKPEAAAFMQIWEVDPNSEPEWVFSGWMFSSSPALSAMDHPIYDVWVLDCLADGNALAESEGPVEDEEETSDSVQHDADIESNTADTATDDDTLE